MEQRRQVQDYDLDDKIVRDLSVLLGVVASAFIVIGVVVYAFGEDTSSNRATNSPPAAEKTVAAPQPEAPPATTGQGGGP
jgi:hypothetical protein